MVRDKIKQITILYYSKPEIQEAIFNFSQNREIAPSFNMESFGKRPDSFQYKNDIYELVKKGATSFHCSQEIWQDPLKISTDMNEQQYNELRTGWDLLLDIDSKYLDYSKILAQLIIKTFKFHGLKNFGVKFSGSKGFHIIIPWKAFPKEINTVKTSDKFPEWPRIITQYLMETTKKELIDRISDLKKPNKYIRDFEAPKAVVPDLILVSSRHLFRMPYSLHEKTALASVVLTEKELNDFEPKHAEPMQIKPREFSPNTKEGEAKELLVQALDWYKGQHVEEEPKIRSNFKPIKLTNLSEKNFSPSIQKILQGIKDGKKRALFILINFFRSIGMERAEIEQRIDEWNKKNEIQLKQGYIKSQLVWVYRNKIILPPNFNKDFYKGIGIIPTPEEIRSKNPTSYFIRKSLVEQNKEKHIKKNISKNKDNFKNKN